MVYERGAIVAFGERRAGLPVETGRRIEENDPPGRRDAKKFADGVPYEGIDRNYP